MDQEVKIVVGWCANCTCKNGYHVGDDAGICLECKCAQFSADDESDILDRFKVLILGQVEDNGPEEEEAEPEEEILVYKSRSPSHTLFFGKVSRQCMNCGETKLYQEFKPPKDPTILCNYCAWEESYEQEINDMEDQIIENEMAYEEALERQEIIDEVLRQLDE